jgi:hypothetical protein
MEAPLKLGNLLEQWKARPSLHDEKRRKPGALRTYADPLRRTVDLECKSPVRA